MERYLEINKRKKCDTSIQSRIVSLHVKDLSKIDAESSGSQLKLNYTHNARYLNQIFLDLLKIILSWDRVLKWLERNIYERRSGALGFPWWTYS